MKREGDIVRPAPQVLAALLLTTAAATAGAASFSVGGLEGLVNTRRESQTIYYSLAEGPADRIIQVLHEIYCGPGGSRKEATC